MDEGQRILADILLMKAYLGEITAAEKLELDSLMSQFPEVRQLQSSLTAQIQSGELPASPLLLDTTLPYEDFLDRQSGIRRRNRNYRMLAAAASLLLVVGTASFFLFASKKPATNLTASTDLNKDQIRLKLASGKTIALGNMQPVTVKAEDVSLTDSSKDLHFDAAAGADTRMNELTVPPKLDYKLTLADGSVVRLNASTTLKFPFAFNGNTREIYVDGEAYFDIAKDEHKPFIVHTSEADVKVLGTSFNVNTYKKGTLKTALVTGSVAIHKEGEQTLLRPGMEATTSLSKPTVQEDFDSEVTLSWMRGVFYFHNTPLQEIADMITRWFDVPTVIDDPELASMTFTGNLNKSKELNIFLTVLSNTADVRYYFKGKELHLATTQH
jgi:transmembrane sensor